MNYVEKSHEPYEYQYRQETGVFFLNPSAKGWPPTCKVFSVGAHLYARNECQSEYARADKYEKRP